MWRSCWGALLLAGLLCLLGPGHGVVAIGNRLQESIEQQGGLEEQLISKEVVEQASDARAGFAYDTCL